MASPSSTSVAPSRIPSDIHSIRLSSMSSEQEESGCCERKKTLEERMNDMVDAVFGAPKHELLKLIHQRADVDGGVDDNQPETTSGVVDTETNVKHDFQETTSFRPCTCAHCNGLVSVLLSLLLNHSKECLENWWRSNKISISTFPKLSIA